jgi:large subunit ribosomal protein L11
MKTPPAAELIKKAAKIKKGSGKPLSEKIGSISEAQLKEIAEIKMPDLNANDIEAAKKIIAGTAKQMGVEIK